MKKIKKLCIIDDDPIFIFGMRKIIEIIDVCDEVIIYNNGLEAIEGLKEKIAHQQELPDVILLDINMPILDGWQFIEEFSKIDKDPQILVYMVSSSVDPEDVLRAKSLEDIYDYITKPLTVNKLRKVIDEMPEQV